MTDPMTRPGDVEGVHINDGSAERDAMSWSEGHTAGYDEGAAILRHVVSVLENYGDHHEWCAAAKPGERCNCGFVNELDAARAVHSPVQPVVGEEPLSAEEEAHLRRGLRGDPRGIVEYIGQLKPPRPFGYAPTPEENFASGFGWALDAVLDYLDGEPWTGSHPAARHHPGGPVMTDHQEGLSAEKDGGLTRLAENRQMPDYTRPNVSLGEVRAALDAARDFRPVGEGHADRVLATLDYEMGMNVALNPNLIAMWRATITNLRAALADTGPVVEQEGLEDIADRVAVALQTSKHRLLRAAPDGVACACGQYSEQDHGIEVAELWRDHLTAAARAAVLSTDQSASTEVET